MKKSLFISSVSLMSLLMAPHTYGMPPKQQGVGAGELNGANEGIQNFIPQQNQENVAQVNGQTQNAIPGAATATNPISRVALTVTLAAAPVLVRIAGFLREGMAVSQAAAFANPGVVYGTLALATAVSVAANSFSTTNPSPNQPSELSRFTGVTATGAIAAAPVLVRIAGFLREGMALSQALHFANPGASYTVVSIAAIASMLARNSLSETNAPRVPLNSAGNPPSQGLGPLGPDDDFDNGNADGFHSSETTPSPQGIVRGGGNGRDTARLTNELRELMRLTGFVSPRGAGENVSAYLHRFCEYLDTNFLGVRRRVQTDFFVPTVPHRQRQRIQQIRHQATQLTQESGQRRSRERDPNPQEDPSAPLQEAKKEGQSKEMHGKGRLRGG